VYSINVYRHDNVQLTKNCVVVVPELIVVVVVGVLAEVVVVVAVVVVGVVVGVVGVGGLRKVVVGLVGVVVVAELEVDASHKYCTRECLYCRLSQMSVITMKSSSTTHTTKMTQKQSSRLETQVTTCTNDNKTQA